MSHIINNQGTHSILKTAHIIRARFIELRHSKALSITYSLRDYLLDVMISHPSFRSSAPTGGRLKLLLAGV